VFGPVEALIIARFPGQDEEPPFPFRILTVAERAEPVVMTGGPRVVPDHALEDCPQLDILLVPGGRGTRTEYQNNRLIDFIRRRAKDVEVLASVCTGAALLGRAGVLAGVPATTNRRAFEWVVSVAPEARWSRTVRWSEAGRVVTAAGVSAGTDMALHLVARLLGPEVASASARRMEYAWNPDPRESPV
jgi:transcriptional regulator GlxA family with amidase domain